jgi:hypothetical protein
MSEYDNIQQRMNALFTDCLNSNLLDVYAKVRYNFNRFCSARYTIEEMQKICFVDDNPLELGLVEKDTMLYDEINILQQDIINLFGENRK